MTDPKKISERSSDELRLQRATLWLDCLWNAGDDLGDLPYLLVRYEHHLMDLEAERQRR